MSKYTYAGICKSCQFTEQKYVEIFINNYLFICFQLVFLKHFGSIIPYIKRYSHKIPVPKFPIMCLERSFLVEFSPDAASQLCVRRIITIADHVLSAVLSMKIDGWFLMVCLIQSVFFKLWVRLWQVIELFVFLAFTS